MQSSRWTVMWYARALGAVSLLAVSSTASVIVVSSSGGGQFTNLQMAVDSAADGDTLLVKAGGYSSFTVDAKGLSVVADTGAAVTVSGSVVVQNLAANQNVVLAGLTVTGVTTTSMDNTPGVALLATANAGALRVDACSLTGAKGYGNHYLPGPNCGYQCCCPVNHASGWDGVLLAQNSGGIGFVGCTIVGGNAANAADGCDCGTGVPGGVGVLLASTRVALYDCAIVGGRGGNAGDHASDGAAGCRAYPTPSACGLFASGTSFTGGRGGDGVDLFFSYAGNGGPGIYADLTALVQLLDCTTQGGAGGISCGVPNGQPGQPTAGTSAPFLFNNTRLVFNAPTTVRENTDYPASFAGQAGEHVYLYMADSTGFRPSAPWEGVLVTHKSASNQAVYALDMGTIPQGGVLNTVLNLSDVASARTLYLQAFSINAQGNKKLGSFAATVVLDSSY